MKYGVVLPIWQLTVAEAESLATRAEELGTRRRVRPRPHPGQARDHPALRRPLARSVLAAGLPGRAHAAHPASAPASSCSRTATRWSRPRPRRPWTRPRAAGSSSGSAWAGTRRSSWTCGCRSASAAGSATITSARSRRRSPPTSRVQGQVRELLGRDVLAAARCSGRIRRSGWAARPARSPAPPCGAAPSWATPGIPSRSASTRSRRATRRCATSPAEAGGRNALGLAPRNTLDLTDAAEGRRPGGVPGLDGRGGRRTSGGCGARRRPG